MLHRKSVPVLVLLATCLSGCLENSIDAEMIGDVDDDDVNAAAADVSCAILEATLAVDMDVSEATASNAYEATSFDEWCTKNVAAEDLADYVGNANAWQADETDPVITGTSPFGRATRPTLAQGARLDVYVLEPEGPIPFMRKIHYANWEGPGGSCALEMRVYQRDVNATGKKPLLYLHGGAWRYRSATMTAADVFASHLLDTHVVFVPSYPLAADKDGPAECRHAHLEDIESLAQEAFDWVATYKNVFGATAASRIDLMGHSAGAQLATWLATQNREQVGKLVAFYAPVEFADFVDAINGDPAYADEYESSANLLASVLGAGSLDAYARPYPETIMENSLSETIAAEGAGRVPPFFLVHGNADETVPVRQSLLGCRALGGEAGSEAGRYTCGTLGQVAVVEGAGHNLDMRCASEEWPPRPENDESLMGSLCPRNEGNRTSAYASVRDAYDWIAQ